MYILYIAKHEKKNASDIHSNTNVSVRCKTMFNFKLGLYS